MVTQLLVSSTSLLPQNVSLLERLGLCFCLLLPREKSLALTLTVLPMEFKLKETTPQRIQGDKRHFQKRT